MDDFFKHLINVFTDSSIPVSRRGTLLLIGLLAVYVVNDTFNFTFNYRIDKRISQIKEIQNIYPASMRDSIQLKSDLDNISAEIRLREPWVIKIKSLYENIAFYRISNNQKIVVMRFFSGSIIFFIIAIIIPFVGNDKKGNKSAIVGIVLTAFVVNVLLFLVPTFDYLLINHMINILTSLVVCILFYYIGTRKNTRSA